ncbi:MAG: translation initiation factor IF-2 [Planctomycetota bacterium]|nr:translation initiation factor IF-2 [Planctomycetota bacterium]
MPKRIYALAKELAMDSKELVDLCTKIGIPNKGSALASLEDDEVEKLEKHLSGASKPEEPPAAPQRVEAPIRSTSSLRDKPRVLDTPTLKAKASEEDAAEEPAEISVPEVAAEDAAPAPEVISSPEPTAASEPAAPDTPPQEQKPAPLARGDYIGPGQRRVRSLDARGGGNGDAPKEEKRRPAPRKPVIKLGNMPKADQPVSKPKQDGPAPQRPEIRFTKNDISGQKQGMKAPVQQQMEQQQAAEAENRGRLGGRTGAGAGGLKNFKDAADRAKGRRGEGGEDEDGKGRKKGSGIQAARAERRRRGGRGMHPGDDDRPHRSARRLVRKGTNTAAPRKDKAVLELPCTVRSFSEAAGVPAGRVVGTLMQLGHGVTINSALETELAETIAIELGVELEFREPESLEEGVIDAIENFEDPADDLTSRPPIVTFLGHVDHGKTSLLDYLIGTRVVTGEAGGITQHIRAYQVEKNDQIISFVDTPGHEAFTEMRARGANVTDIAVLVIAADDGIMPQTEEAISHAKAAGVPIVVALNKIDVPGVDANRVLTQMTEHELTPSEWGGDVEVVKTSAITGEGMDDLLETLLTVAELHEYQANSNRAGVGVCLESEQASNRGVIAKVVVQTGVLKVGDVVLCGTSYGRVKAIYDTLDANRQLQEAGPSMPVNITGLDTAPGAGDRFYVLEDIAQARELAESRSDVSRAESLSGSSPKVSFIDFQQQLQDGTLGKVEEKVELNLIIRADARGSLEAIEKELGKLDHPEVEIRALQKSVGGITVADVTLASASGAVIVGFNVIPDENARSLADDKSVEIRRYDIIYKLAEDIKAIVEGRLRPEERVVELGRALVKTVFNITRVGAVAGCYVAQGQIERGCRIRVNRDGRTIGDYGLDSLKRHKEDVKEVPRGMECGIKLAGFNDLKQDDVLEAYRIEEIARTLD